jgi:TolB-like protein
LPCAFILPVAPKEFPQYLQTLASRRLQYSYATLIRSHISKAEMVMWRMLALLGVVGFSTVNLPAQTSDPATDSTGTILVFPFEMAPGATGQWIGRGAQQDLMTDLTQATRSQIKGPAEPFPARDAATALKQAHELNATIVIFGQAQVVDLNVRLTGQVLEAATGRVLGAIKVTGPLTELFPLEDVLAREVFAALPQDLLKPEVLQYLRDTSGPMQQPAEGPTDPLEVAPVPPPVSIAGPGTIVYEPETPPYGPTVQPISPDYSSLGWNDPGGFGPYDAGLYAGGWFPPGTIVITSVGSSGRHRNSHHEGGHGRWDGGNDQSAPRGSGNQVAGAATSDPVTVRFSWGGSAGQVGAAGGTPVQAAPRGFSGNGFSRGGFSTTSGPRFGNNGFHSMGGFGAGLGNTGRGGTVGR